MENESKNKLIEKTLDYCQQHVYGFSEMDEQKREWYLKKVSRLLLDDKDVLKEIFFVQLN